MQKYIGTKIVIAKPMTRGAYNAYRGWTMPADENAEDRGYLVEYTDGGKPNDSRHDGYISWSPADVFERSYLPTSGMTFGMAIDALKAGKRVTRRGWNGKGMYLWLLPAAQVKAEWCREPHLKAIAEANGGEVECLASIRMKASDGKVLTGWLASQSDMMADDWMLVEG